MSEFTFVQLSTKPPQWTIMQADGERETSIGGVQFDEGWLSVWVEGAHELEGLRHVQVPLETTFDDILRLALEAVQEWDVPEQAPEIVPREVRPGWPTNDPLFIEPPVGMAYKWVVTHVMGEPVRWLNQGKTSPIVDAQAHGWVLVPEYRHLEFAFPHGPGGAVLMERPKAEADAAIAELANIAYAQQRNFLLNGAEWLSGVLPPGFTAIDGIWRSDRGPSQGTHVYTPRGWIPIAEYRAAERADGTNPLDDD